MLAHRFLRRLPILVPFLLVAVLPAACAQVDPPAIIRQPRDVSKSLGDTARLTPGISGGPGNAFQWFHDGVPVPGATNQSLVLTNLVVARAGLYSLSIINEAGSVVSDPAKVEVDTRFVFVTDTPITRDTGWQMAWADYNGDGLIDLLCSGQSSAMLYRNDGNGRFTKITRDNLAVTQTYDSGNGYAGWLDFDNDGRPDIFITTGSGQVEAPDFLFRNVDGNRFEPVSNAMTRRAGAAMSAAWGDVNGDGRLDFFMASVTSSFTEKKSELWLSQPNGDYALASPEAFPALNKTNLGSIMFDQDLDGDMDILVGTFNNTGPLLYENLGGGNFQAIRLPGGPAWISGPMAGDYDNDGLPDVLVGYTRVPPALLHNDGAGQFTLVSGQPIAEERGSNWGASWADYDNDGWLDVFLPKSIWGDGLGSSDDALWHNEGDGTFTRVAAGSLGSDGIDSGGPAWGDYNDDGFLDLAVAGSSGSNRLYRNAGNGNAWIMLRLVGHESNRDATGALVKVRAAIGGPDDRRRTQYRQANATSAWSGQNDPRIHFGLAGATQADEIEIRWPSGKVTTLKNVPARQILTVFESDDRVSLSIAPVESNGSAPRTVAVTARGRQPGLTLVVERSTDLKSWTETGRIQLGIDGTAVLAVAVDPSAPAVFRTRKP